MTTTGSLMSQAKPLFKGGVAGAAAIVVYDKFLAAPIRGAVGPFAGAWTDTAISFGVALGIQKLAKGKEWGHDAAVSLFAHNLAIAFETNVPQVGSGGGASGSSWVQATLAGR